MRKDGVLREKRFCLSVNVEISCWQKKLARSTKERKSRRVRGNHVHYDADIADVTPFRDITSYDCFSKLLHYSIYSAFYRCRRSAYVTQS